MSVGQADEAAIKREERRDRSIVAVVFHVCALIGVTLEPLAYRQCSHRQDRMEKMGLSFFFFVAERQKTDPPGGTHSKYSNCCIRVLYSLSLCALIPPLTNQLLVYLHTFPHYFCNLFPLSSHPRTQDKVIIDARNRRRATSQDDVDEEEKVALYYDQDTGSSVQSNDPYNQPFEENNQECPRCQ